MKRVERKTDGPNWEAGFKPGDLVKFRHIYNGCMLNDQTALYLGPDWILRDDGITIYNFRVLVTGSSDPITCDKTMYKHMKVINECR
tara:strand:- start:1734 stop:1994 length:261 start_codon:yes stop_codon:yes gene_type:complete